MSHLKHFFLLVPASDALNEWRPSVHSFIHQILIQYVLCSWHVALGIRQEIKDPSSSGPDIDSRDLTPPGAILGLMIFRTTRPSNLIIKRSQKSRYFVQFHLLDYRLNFLKRNRAHKTALSCLLHWPPKYSHIWLWSTQGLPTYTCFSSLIFSSFFVLHLLVTAGRAWPLLSPTASYILSFSLQRISIFHPQSVSTHWQPKCSFVNWP